MNPKQCDAEMMIGVNDKHDCFLPANHVADHECYCGYKWPNVIHKKPEPVTEPEYMVCPCQATCPDEDCDHREKHLCNGGCNIRSRICPACVPYVEPAKDGKTLTVAINYTIPSDPDKPKKKTVYIAGPMRGIRLYNFPAFDAAKAKLEAEGYDVFSPADYDRDEGIVPELMNADSDWNQLPPGFDFTKVRQRDITEIDKADCVYFLNGWNIGRRLGCTAEHAYAVWAGKEIMYQVPPVAEKPLQAEPCTSLGHVFPDDAKARKEYPMFRGLLKYFPDALAAVAHVSFIGNEQHHPGTPLHWDRAKSSDQEDAMIRHLIEGDYEAMAWRALAALQTKIENGRGN